MKVLIVHNGYQFKGGEDSVVEAETRVLNSHGHQIECFSRHNDAIATMSAPSLAFQTLWSTQTAREFEALLLDFKPAIVHVHNTFPLISPAIYWIAEKHGVPVVQTLHNFRLLCPQAMFLRKQKICEDCLGKVPWRGALRGCYRDSMLQSSVLASMVTFHRVIGTWKNKVTRYIALNEFCRNKFIQGGLPADRISVKSNFVDGGASQASHREGMLFVGRLSIEKGIGPLTDAMTLMPDLRLRVAGTGSMVSKLSELENVTHLGHVTKDVVSSEMEKAIAVIVPSICYETFGLVVVEAFAKGTPVIASRIDALNELVSDGVTGLLFEPGNGVDLAEKMLWAHKHPQAMSDMGRRARTQYEAKFTAQNNYQQLLMIYNDAIQAAKHQAG